jgi:hypothetical protein
MTVKVWVESGGWIWARAHKLLLEPRRDRRRVFVDKLIVRALEELLEKVSRKEEKARSAPQLMFRQSGGVRVSVV